MVYGEMVYGEIVHGRMVHGEMVMKGNVPNPKKLILTRPQDRTGQASTGLIFVRNFSQAARYFFKEFSIFFLRDFSIFFRNF
jgi:hypothetical protein